MAPMRRVGEHEAPMKMAPSEPLRSPDMLPAHSAVLLSAAEGDLLPSVEVLALDADRRPSLVYLARLALSSRR